MSLLIPNSFQTPNIYIDRYMHLLTDSELRVLFYTIRRTFGFQKVSDRISISQYVDGKKNQEGESLDYGTGLARASVIKALDSLIAFGFMLKDSENNPVLNNGCAYSLQLDEQHIDLPGLQKRFSEQHQHDSERTQIARDAKKDRSSGQTGGGLSARPDPVYGLDTQNQVETKEKPSNDVSLLGDQIVEVPFFSKASMRDAYYVKCDFCGDPLSQELDTCPECDRPVAWKNSKRADARARKLKRMYSGDTKTTLPAFLSDTTMKVARLAEIKEFPAPRKKDGNHHFLEQGLHKYELLYGSEYVMDIARKCQIEHSRNNKPLGTILLNHILRCLENGQDPTLKNKPKFQSAEDKSQGESW